MSLFDSVKAIHGRSIVLLANVTSDGIRFIAGVSKELQDTHSAGDIVKRIATATGGSGGGKKDVAQGGGKDVAALESALNEMRNTL